MVEGTTASGAGAGADHDQQPSTEPAAYRDEAATIAIDPILQFFTYDKSQPIPGISQPFCELAFRMVTILPRNAERTIMLRKLLEAKDAAIRAVLAK